MEKFKPVKTALIGSGMISGIYLENGTKNLKILDVCGCSDLIPERSAKRAEEFGIQMCIRDSIQTAADPTEYPEEALIFCKKTAFVAKLGIVFSI